MVLHLRCRSGNPRNNRHVNTAPPLYQRVTMRIGSLISLLAGAVVAIVSMAVAACAPVMFTVLLEPKLRLGRNWAPSGDDVMLAVIVTLPVKPPLGVTVIVEVFPLVAPGTTETGVPFTVKVAAGQLMGAASNFQRSLRFPNVLSVSQPDPPKSQKLPLLSIQLLVHSRPPGRLVAAGVPNTPYTPGLPWL